MKSKQIFNVAVSFIIIVCAFIFEDYVLCGRIEDYVYEDGKSNVIVANRNAGKQVALTFDDGPCQRYTGEILDILKEHDAKATFFVILCYLLQSLPSGLNIFYP